MAHFVDAELLEASLTNSPPLLNIESLIQVAQVE